MCSTAVSVHNSMPACKNCLNGWSWSVTTYTPHLSLSLYPMRVKGELSPNFTF